MWAVGDDGRVQVLGIWLGGRTTADGHDYGRFGHRVGCPLPFFSRQLAVEPNRRGPVGLI